MRAQAWILPSAASFSENFCGDKRQQYVRTVRQQPSSQQALLEQRRSYLNTARPDEQTLKRQTQPTTQSKTLLHARTDAADHTQAAGMPSTHVIRFAGEVLAPNIGFAVYHTAINEACGAIKHNTDPFSWRKVHIAEEGNRLAITQRACVGTRHTVFPTHSTHTNTSQPKCLHRNRVAAHNNSNSKQEMAVQHGGTPRTPTALLFTITRSPIAKSVTEEDERELAFLPSEGSSVLDIVAALHGTTKHTHAQPRSRHRGLQVSL